MRDILEEIERLRARLDEVDSEAESIRTELDELREEVEEPEVPEDAETVALIRAFETEWTIRHGRVSAAVGLREPSHELTRAVNDLLRWARREVARDNQSLGLYAQGKVPK